MKFIDIVTGGTYKFVKLKLIDIDIAFGTAYGNSQIEAVGRERSAEVVDPFTAVECHTAAHISGSLNKAVGTAADTGDDIYEIVSFCGNFHTDKTVSQLIELEYTVFSGTDLLDDYIPFELKPEYAYYLPVIIVVLYFIFAVRYYVVDIERKYRHLVR